MIPTAGFPVILRELLCYCHGWHDLSRMINRLNWVITTHQLGCILGFYYELAKLGIPVMLLGGTVGS